MTHTTLPTIAILGAGSMGGAVLHGLVQPEITVDGVIRVTNRTAEKAAALAELPGVRSIALAEESAGNRTAVAGARAVLIGVKPGMVPDLLREIADALEPGTLVISLAAGVPAATFEEILPASIPVIRSMPNTPAIVSRALTGLSAGSRSSSEDMELARAIFATVGEVLEVPETQLDALSTISGSGPAYVFLLIEEFTRAAEALGFTHADAALLVETTFRGSTELLAARSEGPAELRRQVTSPQGTTEQAVAVLQQASLAETFERAARAALARAQELAAGR